MAERRFNVLPRLTLQETKRKPGPPANNGGACPLGRPTSSVITTREPPATSKTTLSRDSHRSIRRTRLRVGSGMGVALALAVLLSHRVESIGGQFGLEWAIDAPWRLEPIPAPGGGYTYGPIPVVVVFHDAVFEADRGFLARRGLTQIDPGTLQSVRVVEWVADQPHPRQPVTVVQPRALHEIERKPVASTKAKEPRTEICRPASGQDCTALLRITSSHEWHAMFWYTPQAPVTPGRNIHLEVTAVTQVAGGLFTQEWKN